MCEDPGTRVRKEHFSSNDLSDDEARARAERVEHAAHTVPARPLATTASVASQTKFPEFPCDSDKARRGTFVGRLTPE